METVFLFLCAPQAIPYEIALAAMVAGLILTCRKPSKWKWDLLTACNVAAVIVTAVLLCYYDRFSGLSYFGETVLAFFGCVIFSFLTLITLYLRHKKNNAPGKAIA